MKIEWIEEVKEEESKDGLSEHQKINDEGRLAYFNSANWKYFWGAEICYYRFWNWSSPDL